ncbi:MAG: glycosyltransferase family 2 protein [Lachnospiraceae bacterium]|nr:glycosyltransferase family 2 protein [Lachnospiraceae bacterium]
MEERYDTLIMITPKDFDRLSDNYDRLLELIPAKHVCFIGSYEVDDRLMVAGLGERAGFICEDDILPFHDVYRCMADHMSDILGGQELPRGMVGWYYQQFLKMQYARNCKDSYYMVWDGDTIPCRRIEMFDAVSNKPYMDMKKEYHKEYFETIEKLFPGMKKVSEKSFIAEHMLIHTETMNQMLDEIEGNPELPGRSFWEKILRSIEPEHIKDTAFSEFETYGTYVTYRCPQRYQIRRWHSFRLGAEFFHSDTITERDYEWLGRDFFAISFEKNQYVREDHDNLFNNPAYQEKLTARQMLQIAQEEFGEGYLEEWEEEDPLLKQLKEIDVQGEKLCPESPLKYLSETIYTEYERLGDKLAGINKEQTYLCYENAAFLCADPEEKERIIYKLQVFSRENKVCVNPVAIIILSYNCKYMMQRCLESIYTNCDPAVYSLVVLDNASTDGVTQWLKEQPEGSMTLLLSDENMGFPAGCNAAAAYAPKNADLLFLNNDTRIPANALFWLRMGLYTSSDTGAVGAVQNYYDPNGDVEKSVYLPEDWLQYGAKHNVYMEDSIRKVQILNGFAMLIKREAFDKTEGFDEAFTPGYLEDDDLSFQLRNKGYVLWQCKNAFIYHAGSQSFLKRSDLNEIGERNLAYLQKKWGCGMTDGIDVEMLINRRE